MGRGWGAWVLGGCIAAAIAGAGCSTVTEFGLVNLSPEIATVRMEPAPLRIEGRACTKWPSGEPMVADAAEIGSWMAAPDWRPLEKDRWSLDPEDCSMVLEVDPGRMVTVHGIGGGKYTGPDPEHWQWFFIGSISVEGHRGGRTWSGYEALRAFEEVDDGFWAITVE